MKEWRIRTSRIETPPTPLAHPKQPLFIYLRRSELKLCAIPDELDGALGTVDITFGCARPCSTTVDDADDENEDDDDDDDDSVGCGTPRGVGAAVSEVIAELDVIAELIETKSELVRSSSSPDGAGCEEEGADMGSWPSCSSVGELGASFPTCATSSTLTGCEGGADTGAGVEDPVVGGTAGE